MEKSRFFREVERLGRQHDFYVSGITNEGRLELSSGQHYLCRIDEQGAIYYPSRNEAEIEPFIPRVENARKYVTAVEQAPPLVAEGLGEGYVRLAEFEDTVLAGKDQGEYGFQFITWQWTYDHQGLWHGHYYDDYIAAKDDFAQRAGLIPQHKQFSEEQVKALHRAASVVIERNLLEYGDDYIPLLTSRGKLEAVYPELAEEITVLVATRDHPAEAMSIRNSRFVIEDIVGGSTETIGWSSPIQYFYNGDIDHYDFDEQQVSRVLPSGAVMGNLVVAAWDQTTERFRSLTEEEIEAIRLEIDAPECFPRPEPLIEPSMNGM